MDAEVEVPLAENPELSKISIPACSRSEYGPLHL